MGSVAQNKVNAEIILKLDKLQTQMTSVSNMNMRTNAKMASDSNKAAKKTSAAWLAGFAIISVYALRMSKKVIDAFKGMVNTYATFEQSLANTQSVARASTEELKKMEDAARRVGATTRSTASDAANALYYLASAGFSASESIAALDGVNALAIATNSDLASTSETVATTIRQYGLDTSAATGIANTFTAAITSSLATMNKLAKSFEYVGPIAAGLGLTVEETTGALEVLYNKGFSGEKAGRGLRSILVDLADSTSVVTKKLGELNISFDQVNPATNKLADIFDTLRENGVNAANAAAIFGKVSGVQLASLIAVASDAKGGINELTDAVTGTNRAFEAMDIQMDTLKGSMDKFKNAEEALQITTGKGIGPVIRGLVDGATGLVKAANKLPSPLLAVISVIGAIAAIAITATVGITLFNAALIAAETTLAATVAMFSALVIPVALVVGGVVALTAGIVTYNKVSLKNRRAQFSSIAASTGVARESFDKFVDSASRANREIQKSIKYTNHYNVVSSKTTTSTIALAKQIEELSKKYKLTKDQVILLMQQNKSFNDVSGENIERVKAQIKQEEIYANASALSSYRSKRAFLDYAKGRQAAQEGIIAQEKEEAKQQVAAEKQTKSLKVAFARAKELQKAFGDEFDRNAYLTDAYNASIKDLVDNGLKYESDEVQAQVQLYKDLQAAKGEVGKSGLTDVQINIKAQKELIAKLAEIDEIKKDANGRSTAYNKEEAKSAAVVATIHDLMGKRFTYEGAAIQQILKLFGDLIIQGTGYNGVLDEFTSKLERLNATKFKSIEMDREAAIESANSKSATIADLEAINAYFDALRNNVLSSKADALDMQDRIDKLTKSQFDLIKAEKQKTLNSIWAANLSIDETVKLLDQAELLFTTLEDKEAFKEFTKNFKSATDKVMQYVDAINDLIQTTTQNQVDSENAWLDAKLKSIDAAEQAALASAGVQEETALQLAQDKIDAAITSGDAIALQDAQDAYDRLVIQQDFEKKRIVVTDEANKKIADLKYKADMVSWAADSLSALSKSALAIIEGYTKGFGAGLAMTTLVGLQLGAIAASMPKPPKFANGGVVPGSSYKGDATPVLADAGELILNKAQQNTVAKKLDSDKPIYITTQVVLDSKVIATSSAKHYRNGTVIL